MGLLDTLKKSRITCPHCRAGFDVGPDLQAITHSASKLIDSVAGFLDGGESDTEEEPFSGAISELCDTFDIAPSRAIAMLEEALDNQDIWDQILEFLEDNHE